MNEFLGSFDLLDMSDINIFVQEQKLMTSCENIMGGSSLVKTE